MNKHIILLAILLSIHICSYPEKLTLALPGYEQPFDIDFFKEVDKVYIHLPSLIVKFNGVINIYDNTIQSLINGKNIKVDFQNNLATINDESATKLIQFQSPLRLTEDTVWIEIKDAKALIQDITNGDLEIKNYVPATSENKEPQKSDKQTNEQYTDKEIDERMLLEKIEPVQETGTLSKEKKMTGKICIDPGHGGEDTGITFPSGKFEKEITLLVAINLESQIKKNSLNAILTRKEDRLLNTKDRANIISNEKVDCYISIHTEAPEIERPGVRLFVSKLSKNTPNDYCNTIADEIVKAIEEKYARKIKVEKFICPLILNDFANTPGILIEIYPEFANESKEEKWDMFLDKKSDFCSIIADVINKVNNKPEPKK